LGGDGTIGPLTAGDGIVGPGGDVGRVTVQGDGIFGPAPGFPGDPDGTTPGGGPDPVRGFGAGKLCNSTPLSPRAFTPAVGTTFKIIDNDLTDAVVGNFSGLSISTGTVVNLSIATNGIRSNDVVLTVTNTAAAAADLALTPGSIRARETVT